jgi:AcrR family transcriptional regulator
VIGSGSRPNGGHRLPLEIRAAIRKSTESGRTLSLRYGVNPKTVRRWRSRDTSEARKPGPKPGEATALTSIGEAMVVCMRRLVMLSLDDCLYVVQTVLPGLSRASVHRCFRRHRISRLPETSHGPVQLGWFDVHVIPLGRGEYAACLYVAIERQSKFIFAEARENAAGSASDFLQALQRKSPVTVLGLCVERSAPTPYKRAIMRAGADAAVQHRLIAASWPVEQSDRILLFEGQNIDKQLGRRVATGRRLASFLRHYNNRCRLKTLGGLTPAAHVKRRSGECAVDRTSVNVAEREGSKRVADKREQILQCARALLSTVGPDGMSLSKVARMAGVNRGSIYHYFKSRSQLIAAASEWSSEQLTKAVFSEPFDEGGKRNGPSNVLRVMRRLANFAMRNPAMSQAWLFQILSMPDPSKDRFWREYHGRSVRFHQRPPAAKDIDAEVLAVIMLAGTFLWPIWARAKSGGEANVQRHADRYLQEFFRLAIHGVLRAEYVAAADAELQAMRLQR